MEQWTLGTIKIHSFSPPHSLSSSPFPPGNIQGNHLMRAIHVATFAATAYASTAGRGNKPFNPLLGETYEAIWEEQGLRFISEKVDFLFPFVILKFQLFFELPR